MMRPARISAAATDRNGGTVGHPYTRESGSSNIIASGAFKTRPMKLGVHPFSFELSRRSQWQKQWRVSASLSNASLSYTRIRARVASGNIRSRKVKRREYLIYFMPIFLRREAFASSIIAEYDFQGFFRPERN